MPWEGAAKPADQFPFLAYAPLCKSSPAEGLLLPSVTLRAPGCRVTHRHSLTHTRKRVPRPRPARLCCRPPVPTGVTGGWGQGHGHPPRFGAKCVLWGAPLRPLVQQAQDSALGSSTCCCFKFFDQCLFEYTGMKLLVFIFCRLHLAYNFFIICFYAEVQNTNSVTFNKHSHSFFN